MKLVCVLVTYNRLDNLKIALQHYESQTNKNFTLVIVDNNSTDGTKQYLEAWKQTASEFQKDVIFLPSNSGGSGGFYTGEKYAMGLKPDWLFVADDDAYPSVDLFERFYNFITEDALSGNMSAICSTVYKPNGTDIDIYHRSWFTKQSFYKFKIVDAPLSLYENKDYFDIGSFSYVGTFLNYHVLLKAGLCNPKLFIFFDDSDHALRMRMYGRIIVVPQLKVIHDAQGSSSMDSEKFLSWRDYYRTRNLFYIQRKYFKSTLPYSVTRFVLSTIYNYMTNIPCLRLSLQALYNGIMGHLGKHAIYRPPYKISK